MTVRIISGALKGRKLFSVKGRMTRPTADRVREAIFNILSSSVQGSVVLDLFAGTGAMGIEALSRGADHAVFIDNASGAISVIDRNIRRCSLENRSQIIRWDILRNLNCIRKRRPAFNLVLMDPPYQPNVILPALQNLYMSDCLEPGACIVAEYSISDTLPETVEGFCLTDCRKYGRTRISFYRRS